jgi:hypothetical protein
MRMYTSTKFDSKKFLGKKRIYKAVSGAYRISRLYVWDEEQNQYITPLRGKCYMARKYLPNAQGKLKRKEQFFETVDEARKWQSAADDLVETFVSTPKQIISNPFVLREENQEEAQQDAGPFPISKKGMLFCKIVQEWKDRIFPTLAESTRLQYEKLLRLYMNDLMNLGIYEITPQKLDSWIDGLKAQAKHSKKGRK